MSTHKHLKIHSDGGARGNPGPAAAGVVIETSGGELLDEIGQYLGEMTNNQAEYRALKLGLEKALTHEPEIIDCYLDSELVVKQLKGLYKMKNADLRPLFNEINELIVGKNVSFTHVYREANARADSLVNKALDSR